MGDGARRGSVDSRIAERQTCLKGQGKHIEAVKFKNKGEGGSLTCCGINCELPGGLDIQLL